MRAAEYARFERLTTANGVTYQPGLDGVRAAAVLAVVGFHLDLDVVEGGYLGVSLFFTLSGFLIGTIVLHELAATGTFSLRRFWARRARRLLPAAFVTLAAVSIGRAVTPQLDATSGADVAAAALDVANWHFLLADRSYSDLFDGPSAVLHFWSLSIEEQFYIGGALLLALVAWCRPHRPVAVIFGGASLLALVSFALPMVAGFGVDRTYYGTDTRAGELMVGVALAAWCASPRRRARMSSAARPLAAGAAVAAVAMAGLLLTQPAGTGAIGRGLLPLCAALSVLVVLGAMVPAGPLWWIVRRRPLLAIGRVSYAWYLVHWPVIVIADQLSADRSLVRAAALATGTLALASAAMRLVERPVRERLVPTARLAASASLVVGVIAATTLVGGRRSDSANLLDRLDSSASAAAVPPTVPVPDHGRPRVVVFGDSVALSLVLAGAHATVATEYETTYPGTEIGCGLALSPWPPPEDPGRCDDAPARLVRTAEYGHADTAVMLTCQWELLDQRLPADAGDDGSIRHIGEPVVDDYVLARFADLVDHLQRAGVERVLWVRCPRFSARLGAEAPAELRASRADERVDALNAVIERLTAARPAVTVLPFDAWVNERVDDASIRPDGAHFEIDTYNPAVDELIRLVNEALRR